MLGYTRLKLAITGDDSQLRACVFMCVWVYVCVCMFECVGDEKSACEKERERSGCIDRKSVV